MANLNLRWTNQLLEKNHWKITTQNIIIEKVYIEIYWKIIKITVKNQFHKITFLRHLSATRWLLSRSLLHRLITISSNLHYVVITGDLNTDTSRNSSLSTSLFYLISSSCLQLAKSQHITLWNLMVPHTIHTLIFSSLATLIISSNFTNRQLLSS